MTSVHYAGIKRFPSVGGIGSSAPPQLPHHRRSSVCGWFHRKCQSRGQHAQPKPFTGTGLARSGPVRPMATMIMMMTFVTGMFRHGEHGG